MTALDGDDDEGATALFFVLPTLRVLPDDESGGPVSADVAGLLLLRVTAMSSDNETGMPPSLVVIAQPLR